MNSLSIFLIIPWLLGLTLISHNNYKSLSPIEKYNDLEKRFLMNDFSLFGDGIEGKRKNLRSEIFTLMQELDNNSKKNLNLFLIHLLIWEDKYDEAEKEIETVSSSSLKHYQFFLKGLIALYQNNPSKAAHFYEKGLSHAKGINRYLLLRYLSWAEIDRGNNDKAIRYAREGLKIISDYKPGVAYLTLNLGSAYGNKGDMALSLDNLFKALELFKELNNNHRIVLTLNHIAAIKDGLGEDDEALFYFKRAEEYFSSDVSEYVKAMILGNIFFILSQMKDYENSKVYYEKALEICQKNNLVNQIIYLKYTFASENIDRNKTKEAIKLLDSLKNIAPKHWSEFDKHRYRHFYSRAYLNLNKPKLAEDYFLKAEALLDAVGRADIEDRHYKLGVDLYKKIGKVEKEYHYYRKHQEVRNRIDKEKSKKLLYSRENDLFKKDIELKESQKKTENITAASLGLFLLLITGGIYYRSRKLKAVQVYIQKQVLSRFLPPTMIEEIMTGKSRLDTSPSYEQITVLFCDVVGFTKMFNREESKLASEVLNRFLVEITDLIYTHNGTVDKFIGDAVMVLFGAPVKISKEEQVQRAVECARAMIKKVEELSQEFQEKYKISLRVRVGINQGEALVGTIGGAKRSDYTAIGHTVNLASRVEGQAQPQQILFTRAVADSLNKPYRSAGYFSLKGIDDKEELFCLDETYLAIEAS